MIQYVIPPESIHLVQPGSHVEIFIAWIERQAGRDVRVKTMRVEGERLDFKIKCSDMAEPVSMRPHEGEVVSIERTLDKASFKLRMNV